MINYLFEMNQNHSVALDDGKIVGECVFMIKDNIWDIIHTYVKPEYSGQGIARELLNTILSEARNRHVKIIPTCSYAKKVMNENVIYHDLLA